MQMKRAFQFAAIFAVLLMAGQPVLAAASCDMGMASSSATCPMGMSEMSSDCPMAHGLTAECAQNCCNHSSPKAMTLPAAPAKPRLLAAGVTVSPVTEFDFAVAAHSDWQPAIATASPPPLYLLDRAFRI